MIASYKTPPPRKELCTEIIRPARDKSEARSDALLWLDKNENTDPDYIKVIQTVLASIPCTALVNYPDCYNLYKKLSNYLEVGINQLIIAPGSDGIIRSVYDAFIAPGEKVLYTEPTFAMYPLYAKMYGAYSEVLHYQASADGPLLTVTAFNDAIVSRKPRLVCLPNPNSPTGTVFNNTELRSIIEAAGNVGAVILIDEAYHPFYPSSVIKWIDEYSHLVVARTFSKAWGCAGIRLGYGIACQQLTQQLHKIRPMYEVGSLSIALAERILDFSKEMQQSVKNINEGKQHFLQSMSKLGFKVLASEGNFLHVAFGKDEATIHNRLRDKVLYRKNFAHPSLATYSRFTATTKAQFQPIINDIADVIDK